MIFGRMASNRRLRLISAALCFIALGCSVREAAAEPRHAIAMQGEPKLPDGFDHFPYADPSAPKGGRMVYGVFGDFDNLNPVSVRSALTTARGIFGDQEFGNLVYEPLMQRSMDEAFTLYPLIAKTVETDDERTFVEFQLDPAARFSDGRRIRPQDVIATADLLKVQGSVRPQYSNWLSKVAKVELAGPNGVRFTFNEKADRELPLLLAGLPVLPADAFDATTITQTTTKPPIGSGPYLVDRVEPGQRITYRRNPDYWAKDLATKRGLDNYDEIVVEYYRDQNAQFEAFKKGLSSVYLYQQPNPRHWRTAYNFPAVAEGKVIKDVFPNGRPANLNAFFFNARRPIFADPQVRRALGMVFDFEWANANLFYDAYTRMSGYFDNSELSSIGRPADALERELLAPYASRIDPAVMDGRFRQPVADGTGADRTVLREAFDLLQSRGYRLEGTRMVTPDGAPVAFEILVQSTDQQRISLAWARTLSRIGVSATVRQVDDAQYQKRKQSFDYDVLISAFSGTLSPGAEQINRWGSAAEDRPGSFNYAGVADPAIDALIAKMVAARSREDFVSSVRAYDRMLISGFYVVPLYYVPEQWMARWSNVHHPDVTPLTGYYLPAFWIAEEKS
ncbi:extracellular solute-binding protein [Aureimonas sp. Leaf324]|uniref:extracellular solute-binding protein n=1 Tax=Aureimonas sp. Leaf324 TaxID=1736336 RepID=UPI0006FDA098|nr:extracellular solute-binding protein [Aureimonas sp. Leaf324]KQQ89892.1 bicyclomycin resistance protein [Aureimonas sp. Leaf324]